MNGNMFQTALRTHIKSTWITIALTFALLSNQALGQNVKAVNNNINSQILAQGKFHDLFKFSIFSSPKKGTSFGFSYGMWKEAPVLQYSLNTGFMWRFGKAFLGNYLNPANRKDPRTKSQFVFMFSPMLTTRLSNQDFTYQELEPFYLGTPNAVYNRFKHSLTLGSTFTISPRGTNKNVPTIRNRSQQDFMFAVNVQNFNFTMYDDYFPVFTEKLELGDNWDRFFTGGGFVRYRFNNQFTVHFYSEVYTGINRANAFLYPDVISYKKKGRKWFRKNYANQDPGQEYFNNSWFIAKLTYSGPNNNIGGQFLHHPNMDFLVGTSAPWTVFSQNVIHGSINYDCPNHLKLHYFLPRTMVPGNLEASGETGTLNILKGLFIGAGASYNIFKF